ncbi:MAG: PspA/IM30 family protein [Desulfobacterales bacterium]
MGIFTRFRDIVSANINAMLDRAEDPEKLIRLMIREMEDTLVELKSSCAGLMAASRVRRRRLAETIEKSRSWAERAGLAVEKGREDLAREALVEKRRWRREAEGLEREAAEEQTLIDQYLEDIRLLEEKLAAAREKQRLLAERHRHAERARRAREEIRRMNGVQAAVRFEEFEKKIARMEAETELVLPAGKGESAEALERLARDEEIERELEALKAARGRESRGA